MLIKTGTKVIIRLYISGLICLVTTFSPRIHLKVSPVLSKLLEDPVTSIFLWVLQIKSTKHHASPLQSLRSPIE